MYRHNGAGEMLVFSAADFEDFLRAAPRPGARRWRRSSSRWSACWPRTAGRSACTRPTTRPSRARWTSSSGSTGTCRSTGLHWFFDHAETITPRNIDRIARSGRRHRRAASHGVPGRVFRRSLRREGGRSATPPIKRDAGGRRAGRRRHRRHPRRQLQSLGLAVVAGQRPHRRRHGDVSAGEPLRPRRARCACGPRARPGSPSEEEKKGRIAPGSSATSSSSPRTTSRSTSRASATSKSVLTVVGGRVVHGAGDYQGMAPPLPPAAPDWSPVGYYGGYQRAADAARQPSTPWRLRPAAAARLAASMGMRTGVLRQHRCVRRTSPVSGAPWDAPVGRSEDEAVPELVRCGRAGVVGFRGRCRGSDIGADRHGRDGEHLRPAGVRRAGAGTALRRSIQPDQRRRQPVDFFAGQTVEAGQLLLELAPEILRGRSARRSGQLDRAEAELRQRQFVLAQQGELRAKGVASELHYQEVANDQAIAQAEVAAAQATLKLAELELSRTKIVAPISGRISQPLVALGSFVEAESGKPLAKIVQLDPIRSPLTCRTSCGCRHWPWPGAARSRRSWIG